MLLKYLNVIPLLRGVKLCTSGEAQYKRAGLNGDDHPGATIPHAQAPHEAAAVPPGPLEQSGRLLGPSIAEGNHLDLLQKLPLLGQRGGTQARLRPSPGPQALRFAGTEANIEKEG
jgi:hypothetical protein